MKTTINLICNNCQKSYSKLLTLHNASLKRGDKNVFCSIKCVGKFKSKYKSINTKCTYCQISIIKKISGFKKIKNPFCSTKCAAIYNNTIYPKKPLQGSCRICKVIISKSRKLCSDCFKFGKHLRNGKRPRDQSIKELSTISGQHQNKYGQIRQLARKLLITFHIEKKCKICNYSNYVECCHIKAIKNFSENTLISDVNHIKNLVWLCPNHHKELDLGILKL